MLKLDTRWVEVTGGHWRSLCARYRTLVTYQTFDCLIKVKTEFLNKSQETYNENEDIAVMMFDISHGYIR